MMYRRVVSRLCRRYLSRRLPVVVRLVLERGLRWKGHRHCEMVMWSHGLVVVSHVMRGDRGSGLTAMAETTPAAAPQTSQHAT